MVIAEGFLETVALSARGREGPLTIPWPMPGNLGGFLSFSDYGKWQDFVLAFCASPGVPQVVADGFERAQKLYILGWLDFDLVQAGELVSLAALELAVRDRYSGKIKERRMASFVKKAREQRRQVSEKDKEHAANISFAALLKHMVEHDGLTDEQLPIVRRCGGSVCPLLTGERRPSLAEIRHNRAHGLALGVAFVAGLLEVVRDLIDYAYRDMTAELRGQVYDLARHQTPSGTDTG